MQKDKLSELILECLDRPKSFEELCQEMNIIGDLGGFQGFLYNKLINMELEGKIQINESLQRASNYFNNNSKNI